MKPNYYIGGLSVPPIDLNNLFKYAVPEDFAVEFRPCGNSVECKLLSRYSMHATTLMENQYGWRVKGCGEADKNNRALALFWAIWQVKSPKEKPRFSVGFVDE